jgi:hypothetical protein
VELLYVLIDINNRPSGPGIGKYEWLPTTKMTMEAKFVSTSLWMLLEQVSYRCVQDWYPVSSTGSGLHDEYDISSQLLGNRYTRTWNNPELLEQADPSFCGCIYQPNDSSSINSVQLIRSRGLAV